MDRVPADRAIVSQFVGYLRDKGRPDLKIDCWPEDVKRGESVVDAIAGDLAIEHTSVDTLPQQRALGEHFEVALGGLERLPVKARLSICVPYELVKVGSDWNAFRAALAHWILNVAPGLPDGVHQIDIPRTSVRCVARKRSDRPPGVLLSRPAPADDTLASRLGQQIRRKAQKLARYKSLGYTTVLLLETRDIALMNQHRMLEAAREGMGRALLPGIDQVWYVEAGGHVAFDLTSALVNGHDQLG